MRNLLALVGLATVTFVALGWYLGWYKLEKRGTNSEGSPSFQLDINTKKVSQDVQTGIDRGRDFINTLSSDSGKSSSDSSWYNPQPAKSSPTAPASPTTPSGWRPVSTPRAN